MVVALTIERQERAPAQSLTHLLQSCRFMYGREIRVGTQGWNYDAWVGPFYPEGTRAADFLTVYARAFDTVEVDSTFYAIPAVKTVRGWAQRTPANFMFSLKLPQEITHERRLRNVDDARQPVLRHGARARAEARTDPHPARARLRSDGVAGGRAISAEASARHSFRDRVPTARLDPRRRPRAARRTQRRARVDAMAAGFNASRCCSWRRARRPTFVTFA